MSEKLPPNSKPPAAQDKGASKAPKPDATGGAADKKSAEQPKQGGAGGGPAKKGGGAPKPGASGGPPPNKTEQAAATGSPGGRRAAVLPWVVAVLVLLILAGAGGAWYWWRHVYQPAMAQLGGQLQQLDSASAEADNKLQDLESSKGQLSSAVSKLQSQQATLNRALNKLEQMQNKNSDDWVLAEAQYLLTVANERLNIARDVGTAIAAMKAADARLQDLANPGLIPVRDKIVHDLTSLRAVQRVDINGMALYLADLSGRITKLPLKDQTAVVGQKPGAQQQSPAVHNWRELLHSIWEDLRSLVVIREKTPGEAALTRPEIRTYLYQNLRLELASARLAVLRRDSGNLRASLKTVRSWLSHYFNTDSSAVSSVLDRLEHMSQVDLKPKLPDLSGALDALQRYRRSHRSAASATDAAAQGDAGQ